MDPSRLFEVVVLALVVLLIAVVRRSLPALREGLQDGIDVFRERVLGDPPRLRVVVRLPEGKLCQRCNEATGMWCVSCRRLTRSGTFAFFAGWTVAALAVLLWHIFVPVL